MGQERAGKESRAECEEVPRSLSAGRTLWQVSKRPHAKAASEEVLQVLAAGYSPSHRVKSKGSKPPLSASNPKSRRLNEA